ncbi:Trace amine-associated receptor 1 [Collichthys lucidus]|uniref:Trace amine-associated receptor 1 n=1 Tax=Collichthys lucidus TaxID=240159 RepID=A0A4U5UNB5_COLLU|nr:Trace amine-associated receptor 1 [Collichthys lucidus]
MEININRTNAFTEIHPCYKIDASYVLTSNPSAICVMFHVFLGSLSVVTVCGNLLVIISIAYFKQLHTPTNGLILSLAVADLLVGVLVFPLTMQFSITTCLYYDDLFCKIRDSIDMTLCTSSILNLCCISVDRYYAVCQPLTYRTKMNNNVVVIMIIVCWETSATIGTGYIFLSQKEAECDTACLIDTDVIPTLGLIFSFYLPVIIMLCIYLKIFFVAQRQARSIQSTKSGATVSKMERKATKTLAIVMGLFLLCWLPYFLCPIPVTVSRVNLPNALIEILMWLTLANSMLNPFVYAFFYSWFRSAFQMIISGKIIQGDFTNSKLP